MKETAQAKNEPPSPGRALFTQLFGDMRLRLIHAVTVLNVADHIAAGMNDVAALAERTGTRADLLYRVLRALAGMGIFTETEDRHFALTPQAEFLRSDQPGSLRDFVLYLGSEWHHRAWDEFLSTLHSGEPSFDLAYSEPFFANLQRHPDRAAVYNNVQHSNTLVLARSIAHGYDFSGIGTLMDVGGGHGVLLSEILRSSPALHGLLFDMPGVSRERPELLAEAGVADRCSIVEGSFFEPLPTGADAIILKSIIHDWDDEQSLRILRNCRAAVNPGGKVLVCEVLLPGRNDPSLMNLFDLEMLVISGGQERTESEYRALFETAGLHLSGIYPAALGMSLLETVPA